MNGGALRIVQAAARRAAIVSKTDAYRLVYSEGDLLPSLIIDNYAGVLSLQTLSQGTEAIKSMLVELLVEEFTPRAVVERNDVRVRQLEGLPLVAGRCTGSRLRSWRSLRMVFVSSSLHWAVKRLGPFSINGKTVLPRESTRMARALDCFTFNGAFALHLAGVCESVTGIDISNDALGGARRNAELNSITNVEFHEANVFDALHELESARERFDCIVLDPPAFAKNRGSIKPAARGYKEINLRALRLLNPGGVLITCTCSYHMSEEMFLNIIADAAHDAKRQVQIVEKRTQASDHPILLGVPETYYLKCVIARAIA